MAVYNLLTYNNKYSISKRILSFILILIIAVMFVYILPHQEAHSFFFIPFIAAALGGTAAAEVIATVGIALIAAGLTYLTAHELKYAIDDYYNTRSDSIKAEICDGVDEVTGKAEISDNVWNDARNYAQSKYNVNKTPVNVADYRTYSIPTSSEVYPYTKSPTNESNITTLRAETFKMSSVTMQGHTYTIVKSYDGVANSMPFDRYIIQIDGVNVTTNNPTIIFSNTISSVAKTWTTRNDLAGERTCKINSPPFFYFYSSGATLYLKLAFDTYSTGVATYHVLRRSDNEYAYEIATGVNTVGTQTINYDVTDEFTNPAWDWENAQTNKRIVDLPVSVDDLVGKTATDVADNTLAPPIVPPEAGTLKDSDKSWLQTIADAIIAALLVPLNLIKSAIEAVSDAITTTAESIEQAINTTGQSIEQAIADFKTTFVTNIESLIGTISTTADPDPDLTQKTKDFKIPDLFLVLIQILLACVALFVRALAFIVLLFSIDSDSSLITSEIGQGLDFIKAFRFEFFDISYWDLVSLVISFMFGFAVLKKVSKVFGLNSYH